MNNIREAINKEYQIIEDAKFNLAELRKRCKHSEYGFGDYSWGPGRHNYTRICKTCDSPLGDEGSCTFIFSNIKNNLEDFKKLIADEFCSYVYTQNEDGTRELIIPDLEKNEYKIERRVGNFTNVIESLEETKEAIERIMKVAIEIGVDVEVNPFIV